MNTFRTIVTLAILCLSVSLSAQTTSLDGKWTLDYWEQGKQPVRGPRQMEGISYKTVTATVPGNVELDLIAAGVIGFKPETDSNVYLLREYEGYQWRYSRHFATPAHEDGDDIYLTFGGVDCYADIYLNGKLIGSPENMLIEHRYEVSSLLAPAGGDNTLEVYLRSSVAEGRKAILNPFSHRNFARPESIRARRAPHTYGWDILPRLVSAGLWRSVTLEVKHPVHIENLYWITEAIKDDNSADVCLDFMVTLPARWADGKVYAEYSLSLDGEEKASGRTFVNDHYRRVRMNVKDARLWWPRGYGAPTLYDASLRLVDRNGNILDSKTVRFGIRTVSLKMTPVLTKDGKGDFRFIVNGEPIFARGSNWTPMDAFHSRDPQHLEAAFKIATDLNCNMLRCWGGNVYEDHPFYDLCDENGILVWQDFSFACALYPQDDEYQKAVREEILSVVTKLRGHASIALWSGNNENDASCRWASERFCFDPGSDRISRITIPSALDDSDPYRSYLPSSPYYSPEFVATGYKQEYLPENHLWGPRGYYKDPFYSKASCLFASETGYHGMPSRESLEKMFSPGSVYPWTDPEKHTWNEDWLTKAVRVFREEGYTPDRNNLMINQVRLLFGEEPTDLDRFIFASQTVQAEAMKYFVERFRGYKFAPRTGLLWWNIRDGWPLISDAVVDWYNNPKMAFWFIRNVQYNVCVMMNDAEDDGYPLTVVNDTRKPVSGKVEVKDLDSGKTVYKGKYDVAANGRTVITRIPERKGQGMFLITYTGENGETLKNHYLYGDIPFNLDQYRGWLDRTGIKYKE